MTIKKRRRSILTRIFKIRKINVAEGMNQYMICFFGYPIMIGTDKNGFDFFYGQKANGFEVTKRPLFSVRNGYKKSLKIGKYHISKL